jgi:5-methylcytosine-specific restriction endonuclease McrA
MSWNCRRDIPFGRFVAIVEVRRKTAVPVHAKEQPYMVASELPLETATALAINHNRRAIANGGEHVWYAIIAGSHRYHVIRVENTCGWYSSSPCSFPANAAVSPNPQRTCRRRNHALKSCTGEFKSRWAVAYRLIEDPDVRLVAFKRFAKEQRRMANQRRRAWRAGVPSSLNRCEWNDTLAEFRQRCVYCGVRFTTTCVATIEHVVALSKGGANSAGNVLPSCAVCNSAKGDRSLLDFVWDRSAESVGGVCDGTRNS